LGFTLWEPKLDASEPLDDPGNAMCPPPPPMPVAEQPAPAASEAVRWVNDIWLKRGDDLLVAVYHAATPADREAILRAFDPDRVSVSRELVEAWKGLEAQVRIRGGWLDNIAALDAAKTKEKP
jgi:hypothetical protein